jgi:hypothetical protein
MIATLIKVSDYESSSREQCGKVPWVLKRAFSVHRLGATRDEELDRNMLLRNRGVWFSSE